MLRPEIDRHVPWWTYVGVVSGGALGYIVGNLPGMVRVILVTFDGSSYNILDLRRIRG